MGKHGCLLFKVQIRHAGLILDSVDPMNTTIKNNLREGQAVSESVLAILQGQRTKLEGEGELKGCGKKTNYLGLLSVPLRTLYCPSLYLT